MVVNDVDHFELALLTIFDVLCEDWGRRITSRRSKLDFFNCVVLSHELITVSGGNKLVFGFNFCKVHPLIKWFDRRFS